jgi:hypothetical protein
MSLATEARRLLERMPPGAREALEASASFVPRPWLYGRTFRETRALLARTERMNAVELGAWQDARVKDSWRGRTRACRTIGGSWTSGACGPSTCGA